MTDIAAQRRYLAEVDALAAEYRRALGHRNPFAEKVKGAVFALLGPRLALDARMPDLDDAVAGTDRGNFRSRRRMVADRIRTAMRGKLGRDEDIDDLDKLLDALCEEEGEDRRAGDEVDRPGFSPALDPEDNPFEAEDAELEELRSQMTPEAYDRLRRRASDRRRARDEESPYESFDRRRAACDDPPGFMGMPRTGGSMVPMPSTVDRPGFGAPRDVAAKDRGFCHARQFGQDSAPTGFASRFAFTRRVVTEGQSRIPGRAGGNP